MEVLQAAQQTATGTLLGTGLLLGIRHGIDWDHIAAIMDIASTTTPADVLGAGDAGAVGSARAGGHASFAHLDRRALWLSLLYAVGHASVVVTLGLAALSFAALLPEWIDPIMERFVGVTLLMLGAWVFYSLGRYTRGAAEFRLQSRWMLIVAGLRHAFAHITAWATGRPHDEQLHVDRYGPRTAYGVGVIHGIGAETGSQVLIIAAVGGAASQGLGIGMMLAFVVGLVISNTIIAVLASTGFISSARARPFYVGVGVLTGVFSIVIGAFFVLGLSADLPDLGQMFGFLISALVPQHA